MATAGGRAQIPHVNALGDVLWQAGASYEAFHTGQAYSVCCIGS